MLRLCGAYAHPVRQEEGPALRRLDKMMRRRILRRQARGGAHEALAALVTDAYFPRRFRIRRNFQFAG